MSTTAEIDEILTTIKIHGSGAWISETYMPDYIDLSEVRSLKGSATGFAEEGTIVYYNIDEVVDLLLDLRLDLMMLDEVLSVEAV